MLLLLSSLGNLGSASPGDLPAWMDISLLWAHGPCVCPFSPEPGEGDASCQRELLSGQPLVLGQGLDFVG